MSDIIEENLRAEPGLGDRISAAFLAALSSESMQGHYDSRLVILSVLIAICAAYAALELAARVTATQGRRRAAWLSGGAFAMGIGIWSMHYVGMLAFSLPVPVSYDWPTVLLSLLAAVFASAVALFVVSRGKMGWTQAILGSVIMGGGISTMHYTGMAAMRMSAECSYNEWIVTLSIVLAILISLVALWLTFQFSGEARRSPWLKTGSAVIMGSAIPIMHYTGMAAARFTPAAMVADTSHAVNPSTLGFTGVSIVTVLILGVAVLTSAFDRRFSAQRTRLAESERSYQLLVEGVRDYAIFMLTPDGHVASWNPGAERIKGYRAEEIIGRHFACFYTEEDAQNGKPETLLDRAKQQGKAEDEGWRVRKDGTRFWADVVITSLRDSAGRLQGFSKLVRDATERKRAEENVRELSGRLLQLQDEERRHLARELHDSAGQILAALQMNLDPLLLDGHLRDESSRKAVRESLELVKQLSNEVRTMSHLLHPPLLDESGLSSAIRWYVEGFAERSKIRTKVDVPENLGRLPRELETAIFRIVQESLTNIHRHSGSPVAEIRIGRTDSEVQIEVRDEGRGIGLEKRTGLAIPVKSGVGIRGMHERVRQLNGRLEITSPENGRGTVVFACFPVPQTSTAMTA
jgi:PAS domain S-box-containing protein